MLWEMQLWPGGVPVHSLGSCSAQRLIQPACAPGHRSPLPGYLHPSCPISVGYNGTRQPFPRGLAQPLLILLPKRIWKTSSQLSRFMKA